MMKSPSYLHRSIANVEAQIEPAQRAIERIGPYGDVLDSHGTSPSVVGCERPKVELAQPFPRGSLAPM
jgi:hypothetical protein